MPNPTLFTAASMYKKETDSSRWVKAFRNMKLSAVLVGHVLCDRMYNFDREVISEIDRKMTVEGFKYADYHKQLMLAYTRLVVRKL